MENLKPKDAAKLIGISYPTIKQWIYDGKIQSHKTPGGHHRIPLSEVQRLSGESAVTELPLDGVSIDRSDQISVRNRLTGVVTNVKYEGLFAEVTLDVGGQRIISIITRQGCEEMGLHPGMNAIALFKATEVMMSRR
jgi:molybdopterin-binding protein